LNTKRRLGGGRGAGVGGDGSVAGGGDAAAADSRRGNKGCGVAGAAMWLFALSYVRSVSAKAAKCLNAL
jgi:hypothetical protein